MVGLAPYFATQRDFGLRGADLTRLGQSKGAVVRSIAAYWTLDVIFMVSYQLILAL